MNSEGRIKQENVIKMKALFLQLETYILKLSNQSAYRGEFMMEESLLFLRIINARLALEFLDARQLLGNAFIAR